jgi:hypothetical protein
MKTTFAKASTMERGLAQQRPQPQPLNPGNRSIGNSVYFPQKIDWGKPHIYTLAYPSTTIILPANFALTAITKKPLTAESTGLSTYDPHRVQIKINNNNFINDAADFDLFCMAGKPGNQLPKPYLMSMGSQIEVTWEGSLWAEITTPVICFHGYFVDLLDQKGNVDNNQWKDVQNFARPALMVSKFTFTSNNQQIVQQLKVDSSYDFEIHRLAALVKTYTFGADYTAAIVAQSSWNFVANLRVQSQYLYSDSDSVQASLWWGDREFPAEVAKPLIAIRGSYIDLRLTNTAASAGVPVVITMALFGRQIA